MSRKNLHRFRSKCNIEEDAESTSSTSDENLTLLAEYDDLIRYYDQEHEDSKDTYSSYKAFVRESAIMHKQWKAAVEECRRLKVCVYEKTSTISDLESKLDNARRLMDEEMKYSRSIEEERNILVNEILFYLMQYISNVNFTDATNC